MISRPRRQFESLGQYHDAWASVLLSAPDNFRWFEGNKFVPVSDQRQALSAAFEDLQSGFHFVERKIKDPRLIKVMREMLDMSFEAYRAGERKRAAHTLQELEGMIWTSRKLKPKYAVEAEQRAFGELSLYKGVRVSPYPYEGSSTDLGPDQSALLELAQRHCRVYQAARKEFGYFAWVMDSQGVIQRVSPDPKEDDHPLLTPTQKSWRATYNRLRELGLCGQAKACVLMQITGPLGNGIVSYDLEGKARPRVSARQLFELTNDGRRTFKPMRFYLEDPQFFPDTHEDQ